MLFLKAYIVTVMKVEFRKKKNGNNLNLGEPTGALTVVCTTTRGGARSAKCSHGKWLDAPSAATAAAAAAAACLMLS